MQACGDSQRQNSPADVTDSLDDVTTKQTLQSVPSTNYILLAKAEQKQSNSNNQNSNNQQENIPGGAVAVRNGSRWPTIVLDKSNGKIK